VRNWEPIETAEFKRTIPEARWGIRTPIRRRRDWKIAYKDIGRSGLNVDEESTSMESSGERDNASPMVTS
jgi:hypothetical protein